MALGLALFLLAAGALCASAQDVEQFCPGQNPGQVKVVSCTSDTGCSDDEKCCSYSNQKRCVGAVVPNFYASLYFVNLTKTSNDISHLTSFVKDKFRDAGIMVDVKAERLGNCAKASLLMLQTSEGKADQVVTSLTENPVSVSNINGGPFRVTSGLDGDLCPDALPTFSAQIHVFNVTDFVRGSAVKNKIKGLIGNVGSGWEYHFYTIGHCVRVTMQAVLTPQQEVSVTSSLEEAEKEGLKLGDNDVTYNVTANSEEARLCYDDYQQMGCAKGFRMCGDLRKCVPVGRFCDGEDDCGNNADESECNFEEYTVKYVSSFPWQSSLDDKNGYSYQQLASTVKASLEKTFLSMSSFVSATVRDILKTKRSISAVITLTFRGPVDASQVRRREKGFLTYGLDSGFINIVITSVIPASQGECGVKDCGEGLCVETGGQAECRCLPGQELHTCKAIDCRGSENYCGNSSIECVKAGHLSGYTCHCPPGWTGEHCQIDICSQLGSTLCGTNGGRCAGDLYNFTLCACSEDNWGVFCQHRGQAMEMSVCQRHRMLSQSLLQHLQGEGQQNADLLNGYTITDRLQALGIYSLRVPGCETKGYYEHMCVYNSSNVDVNICYCTHPNGTYNGSTYTTDGCQVPNTYDPEERAGTCPPLAEGINSFECRQDGDCPSPQKCCQRGAGRVCKDPYTVKGGECPSPQSGLTVRMCASDGDCNGHHKCCVEGKAHICRPPRYVTRFQINVTISATWRPKYSNLHLPAMVDLGNELKDKVDDMKGFQSSKIVQSMPDGGKVRVVVEVVTSPEVRKDTLTDTVDSLQDKALNFEGTQRLISDAALVTLGFCGSAGCGTGDCIKTTLGSRCLCPNNVYGDRCQFLDPCEGGVCQNGGTCKSSLLQDGSRYNHTCHCPPGYWGNTCQVSVCEHFPQAMCGEGLCVGDLRKGRLCSCPLPSRGLFCQHNGTELPYTECERRHRMNNYLADVLKGKETMDGVTSDRLKTVFESLSIDWLALVTCKHDGRYSLTSEQLSVGDSSTVNYVCLDRQGEVEVNCQSKVCSALWVTGTGSLCQHGGQCVGNINLQLCNCTGTGHHGAVCEKSGEDDLTECEHKHNLAQVTLEALKGNVQLGDKSKEQVRTLVSTLLKDVHRDIVWQPDCTSGGSHGYRGCEYRVADQGIKECYCLDEDLERMTSIPASTSGLPDCPLSGACGEFSSDPCGDHGTCRGDINAGILCQCQADYSGVMCDVSVASTQTQCQRRSELSNYILSVLHGYKQAPLLLKSSMLQLLAAGGIPRLEVPTCMPDTGVYKFICTYHLDPVSLDGCKCTNDDGTYKTGQAAICPDLVKPGECPLQQQQTGGEGSTAQQCITDFTCAEAKKCCVVNTVRRCQDPVYVATFRVNVTIDTPWKSSYSNLASSEMSSIRSQIEDVFRPVKGFRSVTLISSREDKLRLTFDVTASADVTAPEMENGLSRLRAYQLSVGGSTRGVSQAVFTPHSVCGEMDCGSGVCVDTSLGARCVCREGTSGDRCQHIVLACNCSEGQQCLRGSKQDALACSCFPEKDASCRLPLWYCEAKADCSGTEKCVHREECKQETCEVESSCIAAGEGHVCDSQPCQHGGVCVVVPAKGPSSYVCRCPAGFTGTHCETNVAICQLVPNNLCTDYCVGDAHVGVLCHCPSGRGGLSCDQPAHSTCERQSALLSDLAKMRRLELTVPGVTRTQLHNLALSLAQRVPASALPPRNCTSDGNFALVQCARNDTTQERQCHCVSKEGVPRSSNVLDYPGFPQCTALFSPEQLGEALCSSSLGSVCKNGGRCVGNLLNGTFCQCPASRAGLFCQKTSAQNTDPPARSLCELAGEVWQLTREATLANDQSLLTPLQSLQSHLFHAHTATSDLLIRADCQADGQFKAVQCAVNLRTEQRVHCYCITPRGVVLQSKTSWPEQPQCQDVKSCPSRACQLTCEHGLAEDIHGCPICQCRHPCDGQCDHDPNKRCVVEHQEQCGRENWDGACTSGVCRYRQKPGMCPVSVSANMTAVQTLKSSDISKCDVTCLDDADCPHDEKCCGVCGAQCVKSSEYTCSTHRSSAEAELKVVQAVQQGLQQGHIRKDQASKLLQAKLDAYRAVTKVWVPECQNNGFYKLTQCYTPIGGQVGWQVEGCFCVDPQGKVIEGTDTEKKEDAKCNDKPGACPFLQPNSSATHGCGSDFDCQADLKCCPDGLGSLCVPPLKPKKGEPYSLDEVINSMCQFGREQCGLQGLCVTRWFTEGKVCHCNAGYRGPFCTVKGAEPSTTTACTRRREMTQLLLSDSDKLRFFLARARFLGADSVIKLTMPRCLTDGQFAVTQCAEDVDSRKEVDCYCVNRQGAPLGGTNVPPDHTPACARLNPCSVGAPLHHESNQSAVLCGVGQSRCVEGYQCQGGRYGDFFCCRDPTSDVDVCELPPSPGYDCKYYEGRPKVTQQRYYYDAASKSCRDIQYSGCADVKANFDSMAACQARCVRKEHPGRCPARTVVAGRQTCSDVCGRDSDCQEDQKCCQTTCGRRCVLALNTDQAVCEMGQPLVDTVTKQPLSCTTDAGCGAGYHCRNSRCCIKRTDAMCEHRQLEGQCRGQHSRYFFHAASQQCRPFTYSGCGANDNNFPTRYHCCNACGPQGRCKEGQCPVVEPVLSMSCDLSCLGDGDCAANQICCNTSCGGSSCIIPKADGEMEYSCRDELIAYIQRMKYTKGCFLKFRPRCDSAGGWQREQCQDKLGICWCVTPKGHVVPGTRVRGVARCQWVTPVMMQKADEEGRRGNDQVEEQGGCQVCPGGEKVQCCNEDLCLQVCAAHPEALCRINPCGGCRAQFYTADNKPVDCNDGATTCQKTRQLALRSRHEEDMVAMAAHTRQSKVSPPLMMSEEGKTQKVFVVAGIPQKCQLMPDSGSCRAFAPYWFYNVTSERCERFVYGQCGGNVNRFATADACYLSCKPSASPCHSSKKKCSSSQECQLTHPPDCFTGPCSVTAQCAERLAAQEVSGVHVPQCTREGGYDLKQCQHSVCWCVKADGVPHTSAVTNQPGALTCNNAGPANGNYAKIQCPGGQSAGWSCVDKCRDARCPGHPRARCVLDLCTCQTRFVDSLGKTLTCAGDKCSGNAFMKANNSCSYEAVCGGTGPKRCEYEEGCVGGAVCINNPCAVCVTDPCTGVVSFVDTLTGQPVSPTQCKNQVSHSNCELRQCEARGHNARGKVSDSVVQVPRCQRDGTYTPLQRRQDGALYCVDGYGRPLNASTDTSDCEPDPIIKLDLDVVYDGDYDVIVPGRQEDIAKAFKQALVAIGIPEAMITHIKVTKGSIVISTQIVRHQDYTLDLAVVRPLVQFRALKGDLTLHVKGGVELRVKVGAGISSSSTTASQLTPPPDTGLSGGAVAAIVIVVLLLLIGGAAAGGVAFYFLYYKRRLAERDDNENPFPSRGGVEGAENKKFNLFTIFHALTKSAPAPDVDFVEEPMEDHYVKVRQ